ncbi:MAG: hypothetical protein LH618_00435 [Saprospiraceae bacterium]|nr:hypothetical protein [Saprospiraceae bacterium]
MDISYLFRILARRKWLIISTMLTAGAVTFFLIGRKPEQYKASVIVSTGIVNYKGLNSDNTDAFVQQYQVENAFANLIEYAQSRSTIKLVSIEMLKHDLAAKGSGTEQPYRKPDKKLVNFTEEEEKLLFGQLSKIKVDSISDPSFSQEFDYLLDKIARSYGYDHDAMRRNLTVKRKAATDYLTFDMVTDEPNLSRQMANLYVNRFMTYYQNISVREKRRNVDTYAQLAADKKYVVDSIKVLYYNYLQKRGLPVLGKQSEELATQLTQLEMQKQKAEASQKSATESKGKIQQYMDDRSTNDAGETKSRVVDKSVANDKLDRVRQLTQQSAQAGGKDEDIESQLAEARSDLERTMRSSARTLGKPRQQDESRRTREELYKGKVDADLNRIDAEQSLTEVNQQIGRVQSRLRMAVGDDEVASNLESDQARAQSEFDDVNKELIKAKLNLENAENPLHIVENAQTPEWPEPNRQVLISVFATLVIGTFTMIALFLMAYLDHSLQSPDLFKRFSGNLPLLGTVGRIPVKNLDLGQVFSGQTTLPHYTAFRESLRKIRSQIIISGHHIFLLVSPKSSEGKTFALHGLAYSLAANNKRVLMLDTNFKSALPEAYTAQATPNRALINKAIRDNGLSDVFQEKTSSGGDADEHRVDIIGNTGLQKSPAELLPPEQFRQFLADLRVYYDFILLESAALNDYSDAHELAPFADQVIAVFNARSVIGPNDKESLEYLRSLNGQFAGALLTEVDPQNIR